VKHKGAPVICNEIPREKNIKLKMQTHRLNLDKEVRNLDSTKSYSGVSEFDVAT
jgi:hypothetical protein